MDNQLLVPQEVQDYFDGKIEPPIPPVTGNQRIQNEMKKIKEQSNDN